MIIKIRVLEEIRLVLVDEPLVCKRSIFILSPNIITLASGENGKWTEEDEELKMEGGRKVSLERFELDALKAQGYLEFVP